jgi:hypothetical protein
MPTIERQLTALAPYVHNVADCVRTQVVPSLNAVLPDGALSTGRPAWKELADVFVGIASSGANFDGNGNWIRYLAPGGAEQISFGEMGNFGELLGLSGSPLIGTRPRWFGSGTADSLPFRPDQKCADQPQINFAARNNVSAITAKQTRIKPRPVKPIGLPAFKKLLKQLPSLLASAGGARK